MKAGWVIAIAAAAWVGMLGFVGPSAWANGGPDEQILDYLRKVDLGLSPAEELALKREFVASGALDRLRMEGKSALSEEENRICAYLTRPVRAKDEANPKGQRLIIGGRCHDLLPFGEAEALFASRGLSLIRRWHRSDATYFRVEARSGTGIVSEARSLEAHGQRLGEATGLKNVYPIKASPSAFLQDEGIPENGPGIYIAKNRVSVHFTEPQGEEAVHLLAAAEGLVLQWSEQDRGGVDTSWTTGEATFFVADSATVGEVVDRLFEYPNVRYASPDGWATFDAYIPARNDPDDDNYASIPSSSQWYFLQNRSSSGTNSNDDDSRDFDVDGPEGWHLQTGSGSTRVAVIDAGFDLDHTELASRWWVNVDEAAGDPGVDDDGNGYVDDIHGANLADPSAPIPDHYHGTMVAGLVGAVTNNGDKVAGSNWGCKIVALRIEESPSQAALNTQTRLGIEYAMAESVHANVVNMSLRMTLEDDDLQAAIVSAWNSGIVLVASSGNNHDDPGDSWDHYPADYDSVLEVAGTADNNERYYINSVWGSGWGTGDDGPDLCAPAEDMLVLTTGDTWTDGESGTSFSSPIVAGLAALVIDQHGLHGQSAEVVRILKGAVDDVDGEVTDDTGYPSIPHPGPDDLGAGRVNFLKALAPPRVSLVMLLQDGTAVFNEGDLNGNSVFNWMDEDLDGDSYSNSDDNNDDADAQMDGDDTDDDGDGIHDSSDADVHALKTEIEAGEVDIKVLFNESMIVDGHGGVDPSVKLILPDGSELVFASVGNGNDDWDTQWVANDRWHGRVTVTEDDIAKMYGDLRLEISGSADMAGEALDWDLATPGAQGYAYPLHMPGFVASASDEDAGVEKNTTVLGQPTWPMAWGVADVVGRGFNTDAADPLSLQSMKVTIHKGYGNQTVVSGAPMTQTGRDFRYEWDTVADGDSEYDVTLKAYDGSSGQILQDMKRDIVVDFSVLMMRELKAWLSRAGGTQQIPFYHATWSRGELQVETEPAKPQQGDSLLVDIWLNEPAEVDSFDLRLVGTGPFEEYGLEMVEYDSTTYRWRGAVPFVTWDAMRNRMEGERRNRGYGRDRQGNLLDANPGTTAYRDSTGAWHDYESDSRDGEHYDTNHAFYIAPFKDVCLLVDASSSMFLPGWELSQVHAPQHIVQWMMDQADSEDWRVAAWRFWNTVEQLADYSDDLDDAWASLFSAGPVLGNLHEPGQFNPGYDFDGWMAMTDVENGLLEAMTYAMAEYDDPKVICIWSDFWHNYGRTADEVEATFQQVAEWDPLFLFGNGAAMHGCQCSEEMREAARISGGGYFEGFGATEVESLYRVIPPVIESRAFLAGVDGEGSDTLTVHVDSTLSVLNVIVPLTAWSGRGVAREQEAREGDVPRSRGTYELEDPFGSPVTPSYSATGVMQWEVESPEVGAWALEVNDLPDAEYSVVARGGSPIELKLLSMGSIAQGATDTIRVKLEWAALENEEFELVDQQGEVVAPLVLDEVDIRVYEGTYTFDEGGHYRVRIRGDLGTQTVERETELCLNVRPAPELVFTAPAPGHADAGWIEYVVRWTDTCPERNATVTIGYDDDAVGGDGPILWTGPENDDQAPDSLVWDLTTLPEGAWYVWGRIDDGLNDPVLTYGGSVQVGQGYQPGWPVTLGGSIQGHLALADLGGDGTVEVAAASTDSNLYVVRHDGTMQPGFPVNLHRAVTAGVAAGDVDDDGELELVVATTQGPGAGLVSVVNGSGSMESGWPQTAGTGTRSTPLLIDLTGDGIDDIVVASYDGWVRAWQGNGTVVGGSWPKNLGYGVQDNSPAGADIDGDGEADVVVCSREGNTSRVWALEKDGSTKWQRVLPCFSWSGIAIGDADADGKQEVVITTVGYGLTGQLPRLHVLNGEDGADSPLWAGGVPISGGSYNVWSSPALGYLEGEGFPRIVVTNADGEVRAYNSAGSTVWVKDVTGYSIRSSPLIADLGGDQDMEVVVTSPNRMYVLSGASGDTITAYCRWTNSTGIPASTGGIADLDGDGDLEIVAPTSGAVVNCWDVPGLIWEDGQEWPQFQRDAVKTGRYAEGAEPAAPEVQGIQAAAPDSLRIRWGSVDEDVYGRDEVVTTYKVYRGTTAFGVDGSVLAGEVAAQDTTFTERPGTVGNPSVHSFYRVTAEDQYGNESALSDETVGEFERNTGNTAAKPDVPGVEEHE